MSSDMFTAFPVIETPRLILRQIQPEDAEALFATFSDEDVMEFYGDLPHKSVEDSRELIRMQHEWYARRQGIRWGITRRGDDTVIGSCGFFHFDEGFLRAEAGYELNKAHWRQGIMTEAFSAILTYGFNEAGLRRVEAMVDGENERSKNFLLSLGFTHEGTLRQRFFFKGRFHDDLYFGLLRDEWQPH